MVSEALNIWAKRYHRPSPIEPRAALMLDLPKGIGGVVTSSPAGSGALLFW